MQMEHADFTETDMELFNDLILICVDARLNLSARFNCIFKLAKNTAYMANDDASLCVHLVWNAYLQSCQAKDNENINVYKWVQISVENFTHMSIPWQNML